VLEGAAPEPLGFQREDILLHGKPVGKMTNCVWSPRMACNIGYALVDVAARVGDAVVIQRPSGPVAAKLVDLPFL
jgi:glycine cleavage system aminomethyltransferase T